MMTDLLVVRTLRATAALLTATLLSACGGGGDVPSAPNGFDGVASAAVPLAVAPRLAASPDGVTWIAWVEGDNARQSLISARINSVGVVTKTTVTANVAGALRDVQITMVGTTPVLTWRLFLDSGAVSVGAYSFDGFSWIGEFASPASAQGDVRVLPLPGAEVSLAWTRVHTSGRFQLVEARRSPGAFWSTPVVIRTGNPGVTLLRSSASSDGGGGLMALWSEAPAAGVPETLLSSRYDTIAAAWGAPVVVDAGAFYGSPGIGAIASASWVAAWLAGTPSARTAVVGKRFTGGVWSAATERIDQGQDANLTELAFTARNFRPSVAWVGVPAGATSGNVRAASFDVAGARWSLPSLVGSASSGFPIGLVLRADGQGTTAAAWSVSQGSGGLQWNVTDAAGTWRTASQIDPVGVAPDLAFFSASDIVTTWYRPVAGGLDDVAVRRTR
jgi:hypothetical protein